MLFVIKPHVVLQPVSVRSPLVQEKILPLPHSLSVSAQTAYSPISSGAFNPKAVKRHQSFHGFQSSESFDYHPSLINQNIPNPYIPRYNSQNSWNFQSIPRNQSVPSIFYHLPPYFNQMTGNYTVDAIRPQNNVLVPYGRVQSFGSLNGTSLSNEMVQYPYGCNQFFIKNPFVNSACNTRVIGRNEAKLDTRNVASKTQLTSAENKVIATAKETSQSVPEKRFGSLETRKHKCYSPTFYSMRCKKHAKKRSIIYALPKKPKTCVDASSKVANDENTKVSPNSFQNLTDSIEICEQNIDQTSDEIPKPAPRCKRIRKDVVYQNISRIFKHEYSKNGENSLESKADSSNNSSENLEPEISVVEAVIHESKKTPSSNPPKLNKNYCSRTESVAVTNNSQQSPERSCSNNSFASHPVKRDTVSTAIAASSEEMPQVVVSNPTKSTLHSPKGALSRQIEARLKLSPASKTVDPPKNPDPELSKETDLGNEFSSVPQMPILDTQNKWGTNITKAKQVCFLFSFILHEFMEILEAGLHFNHYYIKAYEGT